MTIGQLISDDTHIGLERVEKTLYLLDEGNTVPFISRYRKEA
ncbi:MAG TPA: Tex-like N-terminal domain-containing protein, partial [Bacteroidales bacterium]|nr:Tex-like N-terminal domain-containing protein [Bacteroidales bacterium]